MQTIYYSPAVKTDAVNYTIGIPLGEDFVDTGSTCTKYFFIGRPGLYATFKTYFKDSLKRIAQQHNADKYSKHFNTYGGLFNLHYSTSNNQKAFSLPIYPSW